MLLLFWGVGCNLSLEPIGSSRFFYALTTEHGRSHFFFFSFHYMNCIILSFWLSIMMVFEYLFASWLLRSVATCNMLWRYQPVTLFVGGCCDSTKTDISMAVCHFYFILHTATVICLWSCNPTAPRSLLLVWKRWWINPCISISFKLLSC
jgi:hypothetical protein